MLLRKLAATAMLLAVIVSLAACGTGTEQDNGQEQGSRRTTLYIAAQAEPESLDPHKIESAAAKELLFNVYQGLVGVDTDGRLIPVLAEDWEISDDNLTYTFYLRSGVRFHNGDALDAGDVKYSIERLLDEATAHPYRHNFTIIESIEVVDESTVKITLKEQYTPFLANLAMVTSAIIPDGYRDFDQKSAGTGPFKLVEYTPTQEVVLEKFAHYWEPGLPYLDKVVFKTIPDYFTALQALKTGELDVVPRIDSALVSEIQADSSLKLVSSPQNLVQLLAINNQRSPFDDVRVRQAINYAINKQEIIDGVMHGYGTEIASNMSPVMKVWYEDLTDYYQYDPDRARQLLKEAGYEDGFKAVLAIPSPWQQHIDTGEIIVSQLSEVGIDLDIEIVEWGIWLQRIYANRDYDLTIIGFDGRPDPHQLLERYVTDAPGNLVNFSDAEFDQLITAGVRTTEFAERQQIYRRLQEILVEEAAAVYIQDMDMLVAMRANIEGWKFYPIYVIDAKEISKK